MKNPAKHHNLHQDLINECIKGSRRAHYKLYRLYYKSMFNTCIRIINDPFEAEDIMQDAFLKAFTNISQYKREVSFGAWLKKIVINRSIDALRSRKIVFEQLENIENEKFSDESLENEITSIISIDKVFKEIDNLPDGYRVVLSLYLIEGYDHNEIADIMNITSSSSRSQYARAKRKLLLNLKKKYMI